MSRTAFLPLVALGLVASACENNRARGNDREAQLAPPEPPAEIVAAGEAIEGVENGLLLPQPMTEADLRTMPAEASRCLFSYTRVGEPVLGYGSTGVLKLNGKLVLLPGAVDGRYSADGVNVTVRPMAEPARGGEAIEAIFVLSLPDAGHERGFQGFSRCEASAGRASPA